MSEGPSTRAILLVAVLAALAGVATSIWLEPGSAVGWLGRSDAGQRVLGFMLRMRAPEPPKDVNVAQKGDIVPAMSLTNIDGRKIEVPAAWAGKPVLVNLWASWCAPCLKEMPELQAFSSEQGANGVQVVGIALDEINPVRDFVQAHGITYPQLLDNPGPADAGVRLGNPAGVLPFTALVSADGRLLKTRIGPFTDKTEIAAWVAGAGHEADRAHN